MKVTVLGATAALATLVTAESSLSCCGALAKHPQLKGKIYDAKSKEYDARLATYYSANSALPPTCMAMPSSTQDVSTIAKIISEKQCLFGMRSGSHSAWRGANSVDDGITIDFSYMNKTTYDIKTKTAKIQPGSDWGHVYEALNPYGVVAVGGRASIVGVGGFTTGGGYSFHSQKRGFACDAVANFEVVLADGSIVNANIKENPDLFKSLKGGSGNLGFITRVDERVENSNTLWGGFVFFDPKDSDSVFDAYIDFTEKMDDDPASEIITSIQWNGTDRFMISVVSNVDTIPNPAILKDYLSLPSTSNTISTGEIADLIPQFTGPTPLGLYANWMAGQFSNDVRAMRFAEKKHAETIEKMQAAAPGSEFNLLLQFQPVTPLMAKHAEDAGGNVLGLTELTKDGPTIMWMIMCTVDTPENQEKIHPLTLEFRESIIAYGKEIGAHKDYIYLNYALGDQDVIASYGAENVKFLKKTAKRYDPHGVFQKLRRSGFKLPA
ncbi:unnamed protein product [Clonostachys rosea f. rosea IK726]|uniref:FAD-binding PCMH-type domain-containing protein n=2 Tax=Bionectria ochroleuca TaxID=29856 RepID=A0A0B7KHU9_BIOOC|nr:unnamed protein product [Clonostachys rosea f. rosea IK726]